MRKSATNQPASSSLSPVRGQEKSPDSRDPISLAQRQAKPREPLRKKIESGIHASRARAAPVEEAKDDRKPPELYIHRNEHGGIYVHEKDIETLFKFIDKNNYGRISLADIKSRISLFAKEMTGRDFKFLLAGKNDISVRELYDILKFNELEDFDPVAEAFKFYDPEGTGYIDLDRLREVFATLGYGELSHGDMQILVECADADMDGKINLEDFRKLIPVYTPDTKTGNPKASVVIESDPAVHQQFVESMKELGGDRSS